MRILHIAHQYPPDFVGGTEIHTQSLAETQVNHGHSVAVFTPQPVTKEPGSPVPELENGVRIYRIPVGQRSRGQVFAQSFHQPVILEAFKDVVSLEVPDIVHIQHLMGLPTAVPQELVSQSIPYVVTLHDYWYACANAQLITNTHQELCAGPDSLAANCGSCALARIGRENLSWLGMGLGPVMMIRNKRLAAVLKEAKSIIAPSNFVRQKYQEMGLPTDKVKVIYHGIQVPAAQVEAAREWRAARLADGSGGLQIGYIGGISWQKGLHVLIDAVKKLPTGWGNLTIFGDLTTDSEYVSHLREMIDEAAVHLAGPVSREQLWMTLAGFDLLVVPALWFETYSLIVDEAFAVGVPVAASNLGALGERIINNQNGFLFSPGDPAALRDLLLDILANPERLSLWPDNLPPIRTVEQYVRDIDKVYQSTLNTL